MPILLKPEQEKIIESQISQGRFANADQVINTALHLLEKLSTEYQEWLEETAQKIDVAIAEIESGDTLDGETTVKALQEILASARISGETSNHDQVNMIEPTITDPRAKQIFLQNLGERMQQNSMPLDAPHFTREMLHERS